MCVFFFKVGILFLCSVIRPSARLYLLMLIVYIIINSLQVLTLNTITYFCLRVLKTYAFRYVRMLIISSILSYFVLV